MFPVRGFGKESEWAMTDHGGSGGDALIEVHHDLCMGAGNCADVAPDYFDQSDDDGTVVVLKQTVAAADVKDVEKATQVCPVAAIRLAQIST